MFVRLFYFLLSLRSYSCVAVKKCALPPQPLVDHRPAKKWNGEKTDLKCGGGEGVTLQMVPLTREKKTDDKKIGIDRGAGSLEADRRTEKEKKKMP